MAQLAPGGRLLGGVAAISVMLAVALGRAASEGPEDASSAPYAFVEADYEGTWLVDEGEVRWSCSCRLVVFDDGGVDVPLVGGGPAVEDLRAEEDGPVVAHMQGGRLYALLGVPGKHRLRLVFRTPVAQEASVRRCGFEPIMAPTGRIEVRLPRLGWEVTSAGALLHAVGEQGVDTVCEGVIHPGRPVELAWRPKALAGGEPQDGPRVHVDVRLMAYGFGIRQQVRARWDGLSAPVSSLELLVDAGCRILEVEGEDVARWGVTAAGQDARMITARLSRRVVDSAELLVVAELPWDSGNGGRSLRGPQAVGVDRQTGNLHVEASPGVECSILGVQNLQPLAAPPVGRGHALGTYRLQGVPYSLRLSASQLMAQSPPIQVRGAVRAVSVLSEAGDTFTALACELDPPRRPFLEVALPPQAEVWAITVDGRDSGGLARDEDRILIPLRRAGTGHAARPTTVGLLLVSRQKPLARLGRASLTLPRLDLAATALDWRVRLPSVLWVMRLRGSLPGLGRVERHGAGDSDGDASAREIARLLEQLPAVQPLREHCAGMDLSPAELAELHLTYARIPLPGGTDVADLLWGLVVALPPVWLLRRPSRRPAAAYVVVIGGACAWAVWLAGVGGWALLGFAAPLAAAILVKRRPLDASPDPR